MTLEEKLKSKPTREFAKMFMELRICDDLSKNYFSRFDPGVVFDDYEEALDYAVEKLLEEQPCYTDEEYKEIVSKRIKDEPVYS